MKLLGAGIEVNGEHGIVDNLRAETRRLLGHDLRELIATRRLVEAGVVLQMLGKRHLATGGESLDNRTRKTRTCTVHCGGQTRRTRPDDQGIIRCRRIDCHIMTSRLPGAWPSRTWRGHRTWALRPRSS